MVNKIAFVIPIYKEKKETIEKCINSIRDLYPDSRIITIVDDSQSEQFCLDQNTFTNHFTTRQGYAESLKSGIKMALINSDYDIIITMDIDHPISFVPQFIEKLESYKPIMDPTTVIPRIKDVIPLYDVIVGCERGEWTRSRSLGNLIVKKFVMDLKIRHASCGFVVWKAHTLKSIPWSDLFCDWDLIHTELLVWAKQKGASIGECEFDKVQKVINYPTKRYLTWFRSLTKLSYKIRKQSVTK